MKTFYWLVKREFWEHRGGFFWAPVITGGIFLLLNIMGIITAEVLGAQPRHPLRCQRRTAATSCRDMDAGDMSKVGMALDMAMYSAIGIMLIVVLGFVVFFYCLGALYDDRRDRSILFWKSLPISNTSTVLSKVVSATVLAPVIAVVVGIVVGMLQLLILAITLSFHGVNVWQLLVLAHPFRVMFNLIGYIPLYVLWALPSVGWLLLCSAWARSKPFLWAVALPVATRPDGQLVRHHGSVQPAGHLVLDATSCSAACSASSPAAAVFGMDTHRLPHDVAGGHELDFHEPGHDLPAAGFAQPVDRCAGRCCPARRRRLVPPLARRQLIAQAGGPQRPARRHQTPPLYRSLSPRSKRFAHSNHDVLARPGMCRYRRRLAP